MLCVVDIGIGNVGSVSKALRYLNIDFEVITSPEALDNAERVIFPGVGSFSEGSKRLDESGFRDGLLKSVSEGKPLLGICVGMQLLASVGYEGGKSKGLALIDAEVVRLENNMNYPVPHMGWNDVACSSESPLFDGIDTDTCFYFVHSFHMKVNESVDVSYVSYGKDLAAAIRKKNIFGVQFHPEKSQQAGLKLIKNFSEYSSC